MVLPHGLEGIELDAAHARVELGAVGLAVGAVQRVLVGKVLRVGDAHFALGVQRVLGCYTGTALEWHIVAAGVFVPETHVSLDVEV